MFKNMAGTYLEANSGETVFSTKGECIERIQKGWSRDDWILGGILRRSYTRNRRKRELLINRRAPPQRDTSFKTTWSPSLICEAQDDGRIVTIDTHVLSGWPCGVSPLLYLRGDACSDLVSRPGDMDREELSPGTRGDFIPGGVSKTGQPKHVLVCNNK